MLKEDVLSFIEDKNVELDENWYFHATVNDIEVIKKILDEGIKSAYLRGEKGRRYSFNGRYYVSLYKYRSASERLIAWRMSNLKFVIHDISPLYADTSKYNLRRYFAKTIIHLRTSEWAGEFQQYLKIEPSKFVALEYSLSNILANSDDGNIKERIEFLKDVILCMEQKNKDLPIYDLLSKREFNKQKILSLQL